MEYSFSWSSNEVFGPLLSYLKVTVFWAHYCFSVSLVVFGCQLESVACTAIRAIKGETLQRAYHVVCDTAD